jgi:hypothetical protein
LARRTEKGARSRAKCSYCNKNELSLGTSDNKNEFTEEYAGGEGYWRGESNNKIKRERVNKKIKKKKKSLT